MKEKEPVHEEEFFRDRMLVLWADAPAEGAAGWFYVLLYRENAPGQPVQ